MASRTVLSAVSKPMELSVPAMSLSIVAGTPTTLDPVLRQQVRAGERAVAADDDQVLDLEPLERLEGAALALLGRELARCGPCPERCRRGP